MRLHRHHLALRPWSIGAPVLDAQRLVVVRLERVLLARGPSLVLDLVLEDEDALTVIPGVLLDSGALVDRARDALIFPDGMPGTDGFGVALAERVLPHCENALLDGVAVVEQVVALTASPRFEAARAAGCYGAAPLRDALARLAPYRIARRFARRLAVTIDAPDAVGGWALLRDAASVGVAQRRREPAACAWYGEPPAPSAAVELAILDENAAAADAPRTLRIGGADSEGIPIVDPLPLDVSWSSDPIEGPVRGCVHVSVASASAPPPTADLTYAGSGGSAGRIALVAGRRDGTRLPAADTDEITALALALRSEGFAVDVGLDGGVADYDLVHIFGTRDGAHVAALADGARRAGVPLAITPHDDEPERGGWWGAAVTRLCFEHGRDEASLRGYLGLLARRAVSVGPVQALTPYAPPWAGSEARRAALRDATVVFAQDEMEAVVLRELGRMGAIHVVPPLVRVEPAASVAALVGNEPFVLVHAPIGPAGNQLPLARVAADLRLPLVVAGPVEDASYLERIRQFGGNDCVLLPNEPTPEVSRGLRAAAAVIVDPAWIGWGSSRLAAALLDGTRVVVAERRRLTADDGVRRFDPADTAALARALGESWDAAASGRLRQTDLLERFHPLHALRAVVGGYAAAAAATAR